MTIDSLDTVLKYLHDKNDYIKFDEICKDNPEIDCDVVVIKLEKDGYLNGGKKIHESINLSTQEKKLIREHNTYKVSFEGLAFLEKPVLILKNRPYRYTRIMEIIQTIYNVAKTAMIIFNAIAILVLMYLAIEWKSFL